MFKFLKDKLKQAVSKFTKKVDEEAEEDLKEAEEQQKAKQEEKKAEEVKEEKPEIREEPEIEKEKEQVEEEPEKEEIKEAEEKEELKKEVREEKEEVKKELKKEEAKKEEIKEEPIIEEKKEEVIEEEKEEELVTEKESLEEEKEIIEKQEEIISEKETEQEQKKEMVPQKEKIEETISEEAPAEEKKGFFAKIKDTFIKKDKSKEDSEERKKEKLEIEANIRKLEEGRKEQEKIEQEIIEEEKEIEEIAPEAKLEEKREEIEQTIEEEHKREELEKEPEDKKLEEIEETISEEVDKIKEENKEDREKARKEKYEDKAEQPEEKKGFFQKLTESITTKKLSDEKFNELFWELEIAMLENSVAVEVIEKIKSDLKTRLVSKPVPRKEVESIIMNTLQKSIESLFDQERPNIIEAIKENNKQNKPYVVCFVGINGSGKTTTIAKFAHMLLQKGFNPVIAASDTFRAAAIDQLEIHANKLGVKLIKHDYNADPAAVAFDAIKHAESKNKSVVLVDTAGRLHSNANLMEELHKVVRVAKPNLTIFVGESITGNDCIEQAREFDKMVKVDGIILSKADIDEKGGAAISISYVLKKPILYFGVGQNYEDLREFSLDFITNNLNFGAEQGS